MPAPTNVSTSRSFLGFIQFYGKFIKDLSTLTEPLYCLLKKGVPWRWGNQEQQAFKYLKSTCISCTDTVLAHFNPREQIGISCDASDVGIGAVLFQRYSDGTERPITNASMNDTFRHTASIQSSTERSPSCNIWNTKIPPIPLWMKFHSCYRLQILINFVPPTERNIHPGS